MAIQRLDFGTAAPNDGEYANTAFPKLDANDAELESRLNAHEGSADPHPQYLTAAEASAGYAPVSHTHDIAGVTGLQAALDSKASASSNTGDQAVFQRIQVAGQDDVASVSTTGVLALIAGANVTLTTNAAAKSVTIASTGGAGGGATLADGDYGDVVVSSSGTAINLDSGVLSAFGRTLIDDADAATSRTTLGLGSLATQSGTLSHANLLINGDFQINQRAFAGGAVSAGAYCFDRWKADASGAAFLSVSGHTVTLSYGTLVQVVEPTFWGYANLASTAMTVSVEDPSGNLTITVGSATGTITAGSGRRSVTVTTGAGDTGNISVKIVAASAGTVTFKRVKFEVGSVATPWFARTASAERGLCAWYFYRITAEASYQGFGSISVYDTTNCYVNMFLPKMRAVPTVAMAGASLFGVDTGAAWQQCTNLVANVATSTLFKLIATVAGGLTVGHSGLLQAYSNTSAYIEFSAEL